MSDFSHSPSNIVLVITCIVLTLIIGYQIWQSHEGDEMIISIVNGTLYLDNRKFSLVGAGNGRSDFEPGRHPVTVEYSERIGCELVFAPGFGWIGADLECDAILGNVRGRHHLIPDLMAQERLRVMVLDAIDDGKEVTLEVI